VGRGTENVAAIAAPETVKMAVL